MPCGTLPADARLGGVADNSSDHRLARAAGRATRAFQERQREDDERLRAERARLQTDDERRIAERRAARERELDERDAAEAGRTHPLLRLARLWWGAITVLLAGLAAAFIWNGMRASERGGPVVDVLTNMESVGPLGGPTGQYMMGGAAALLALTSLWGWIGLLRRRRSAVSTLTFLTVLLAAPAFLRGNALLIVLAALLIIGAALIWLPPVRSRLRR